MLYCKTMENIILYCLSFVICSILHHTLEKVVSLLNRFLLIPSKHLFVNETFEFFFVKNFSFKNAFHLTKVKKFKFLKIDFRIKC